MLNRLNWLFLKLTFENALILANILTWVALWLNKPNFWTGFNDGFNYQTQIRAMQFSLLPVDANFGISDYPFFVFYSIAKVASLLDIRDLSDIWVFFSMLASSFSIYFISKAAKRINSSYSWIILSFFLILVLVIAGGTSVLKPHEFLALSLSYAIFLNIINPQRLSNLATRREFRNSFILLGLVFGIYPIYPFLTFLCLLLYSFYTNFKFEYLPNLKTSFWFLITSAPTLIPMLVNRLGETDNSRPSFPEEYDLFHEIQNPILLLLVILIISLFSMNLLVFNSVKVYEFFPICVGFWALAIVWILMPFIVLSPFPSRFMTFGAIGSFIPLSFFIINLLDKKSSNLNSSEVEVKTRIFTFGFVFPVLIVAMVCRLYFAGMEPLRDTFALSKARSENSSLQKIALLLEEEGNQHYLLSNGEYRFLQLYSKSPIIQVLPFNEGWTPPNFRLVNRLNQLNEISAATNKDALENWLVNYKVTDIILEMQDTIKFESLIFNEFPNSGLVNYGVDIKIQDFLELSKNDWNIREVKGCSCLWLYRT